MTKEEEVFLYDFRNDHSNQQEKEINFKNPFENRTRGRKES